MLKFLSDLRISFYISVLTCALIASTACTKNTPDSITPIPTPIPTPTPVLSLGKVQVWLTTGDQYKLLFKETSLDLVKKDALLPVTIAIDTTVKFQSVEGYGAALTGSSAHNIYQLSDADKQKLLVDLFDADKGIGISYLRITIGASDFSLSDFTYDDVGYGQTDAELKYFSVAEDKKELIPILKLIKNINPNVKILASPWSPPAWMKTSNSIKGGKLRSEFYSSYANYFVKYIQAYQNEGIPIDAVTLQNEPLYFTATYPCMDMSATEQTDFIKNNLGPTFQKANIKTKIIVYDHNWDHPEYATAILTDTAAAKYISGSAFHGYAGNVSSMTPVHTAFPDKDLYFTEISGGDWAPNFSDNLVWNMSNIFIGTAKNWSKTALMWNLALNERTGPQNNGCAGCRGVVSINSVNGTVSNNVEYYATAHFSKFLKSGAYRVSSTCALPSSQLDQVCFINQDGTKTLIVLNPESDIKKIKITVNERQFSYSLQAKSVVTFLID